jgi:hypothetical protein
LGVDKHHRRIGIVNFHSYLALCLGDFVQILPGGQGKREGCFRHRGSTNEFASADSRVMGQQADIGRKLCSELFIRSISGLAVSV